MEITYIYMNNHITTHFQLIVLVNNDKNIQGVSLNIAIEIAS